jgi:dolichol-phosphate mannosyltransferase
VVAVSVENRFFLRPLAAQDYRISVVTPVFSETDSVRDLCQWLTRELGERLLEIIIVISPRSNAASQAVCRSLAEQDGRIRVHVQQQDPGVGRAFREGYARAQGNPILSMDSDGEMAVATIPLMLAEMARGNYGLVIGSRWMTGGGFVGYSRFKYWLNWAFQQIFRVIYWTKLHDLTYGFKLHRAEVLHGIVLEAVGQEIGCESTVKPIRLGVPVAEVPTVWTARTQGRSTNNFWRNFRYLGMALKVLFRGVATVEPSAATASGKKAETPAANDLS